MISLARLAPAGEIVLFVGPMFSGKTDELIRRFINVSANQRFRPLCIGHTIDHTKADRGRVSSRTGASIPAEFVQSVNPRFRARLLRDKITHLFIDEGQFFMPPDEESETLAEFAVKLAKEGINVYISTLKADSQGKPWLVTSELVACSSSIFSYEAWCDLCSHAAHHTQASSDKKGRVDPDAQYTPRCTLCFEPYSQ